MPIMVSAQSVKKVEQGAISMSQPDWENAKVYYDWMGNQVEIGETLLYKNKQLPFTEVAGFSRQELFSFLESATTNTKNGTVFRLDENAPKVLADIIVQAYIVEDGKGKKVFEIVPEEPETETAKPVKKIVKKPKKK